MNSNWIASEIECLRLTELEKKMSISDALLGYLKSTNDVDRALAFKIACEQFSNIAQNRDSDRNLKINEDTGLDDYFSRYGRLADKLISYLVKESLRKKLPEIEFYNQLWGKVYQNPLFETADSRFVFYNILSNELIPYFDINIYQSRILDDLIATEVQDRTSISTRRALFLLNQEFSHKYQEAYFLLKEILTPKTFNEQVIVLSEVISKLRRVSIEDMLDRINNRKTRA